MTVAENSGGRPARSGLGAGLALAVGGDLSRFAEQRGVVRPKHLAGESHRSVDLRQPEWPVGHTRAAQSVDQRLRAGLKILLQVVEGSQRHLADRKLAGVIPTGADQLDQRFGFADIGRVEGRAGRDLFDRAEP